MKWLDHLAGIWNDKGEREEKIRIKRIWFYPWKYHTKEDVWRGLISEVIINSIGIENANLETVRDAKVNDRELAALQEAIPHLKIIR